MFQPVNLFGFNIPVWAMYLIFVWELVWKAFALWKSARNSEKAWFIAILLINTLGLLPITYLLIKKYSSQGK